MARRGKRNRKKQQQGVSFPAPLATVLVLGALMALSYLWLCGRCEDLGKKIQDLEVEKVELERHAASEEYKWINMTALKNMKRLLRNHRLQMEWPKEDHVIRLPRSALRELDHIPVPTHPQYAQGRSRVRND